MNRIQIFLARDVAVLFMLVVPSFMAHSQVTPQEHLRHAATSFDGGDFETAIRELTIYLQYDSSHAELYFIRGRARYMARDYKEAIVDARRTVELDSNQLGSHLLIASCMAGLDKMPAAIEECSALIGRHPDYLQAYIMRGAFYIAQGEYQSAVLDYKIAVKLKDSTPDCYTGLAIAYDSLREYEDAHRAYSQSIELVSTNPMTHLGRGLVRIALHDTVGAIDDFSQAIQHAAKLAKAYYYRGRARIQTGSLSAGCADIRKARELSPSLVPSEFLDKCR